VRIAVVGGQGTVGNLVVAAARASGHDVRSLSRSSGVDVATGEGLEDALRGVEVAVDAAGISSMRRQVVRGFFSGSARSLQSAAARCGVGHLVVLSVVGCDLVRRLGYYDAKALQERRHLDGPVPATILRATQFHEFAEQIAPSRRGRGGIVAVPRLLVQSVAARDVADRLLAAALAGPHRGRLPDVAGPPPPAWLPARCKAALARRGRDARVVGVPILGAAGEAIAHGALLPAADATIVGPSFEEWLDSADGPAGRARA